MNISEAKMISHILSEQLTICDIGYGGYDVREYTQEQSKEMIFDTLKEFLDSEEVNSEEQENN